MNIKKDCGQSVAMQLGVYRAFDTKPEVSGYSLDLGTGSNAYAAPVSAKKR
jgi:hypothetical protein